MTTHDLFAYILAFNISVGEIQSLTNLSIPFTNYRNHECSVGKAQDNPTY